MATARQKGSTSTAKKTTPDKPAEEDPLAPYRQPVHEGDAAGGFWEASVTEGGHSVSLHAKTKEEIEERAKATCSTTAA
jgi:hypothetical protein